jgi:putative holliday junction resolvase
MRDLNGHASTDSPAANFLRCFATPVTAAVALGFDFGTRRIGVAIGNTLTREARVLATIDVQRVDQRWSAISAVIEQWQPQTLVVGIPRYPDGAPHRMTARCERFARQLEGRYRLPVARVDERYSSAVVENSANVDAEAASVILRQWLDETEGN